MFSFSGLEVWNLHVRVQLGTEPLTETSKLCLFLDRQPFYTRTKLESVGIWSFLSTPNITQTNLVGIGVRGRKTGGQDHRDRGDYLFTCKGELWLQCLRRNRDVSPTERSRRHPTSKSTLVQSIENNILYRKTMVSYEVTPYTEGRIGTCRWLYSPSVQGTFDLYHYATSGQPHIGLEGYGKHSGPRLGVIDRNTQLGNVFRVGWTPVDWNCSLPSTNPTRVILVLVCRGQR